MNRLKSWLMERWFDVALWWDRRAIREEYNRQAEEEAQLMGRQGTRYIDPHTIGHTRGRQKARSPRRRRG